VYTILKEQEDNRIREVGMRRNAEKEEEEEGSSKHKG